MKQVTLSREATRALRRRPARSSAAIVAEIEPYAPDPPSLANPVKARQGAGVGLHRLRVGGDRVIVDESDTVVAVIRIGPRGNVSEEGSRMDIQDIITPAGETLVVLAKADFLALVGAAEDHADIAAVEADRKAQASGDEDALPLGSVQRMLAGDSPVRVWREFRGLSISALAKAASLSQPFVSPIERGDRKGTTESLGALARALRVSLDDLV